MFRPTYCLKHIPLTLSALILLTATQAPCPAQVISELEDPPNYDIDDYVDILAARIEQDGGLLTFVIETRGEIPTTLPRPEDSITYLWYVDADNDPNTGQPHNDLGSEFNVRAVVSEVHGGGFVDVTGDMPGGGLGEVAVQGNSIQITIGLQQIANPEQFHWASDSFQVIDEQYVWGNGQTVVAVATPFPYTPPYRVTVTTPLLMLCPDGPATGQLEVEIRDANDQLLPIEDYHLSFNSTNEEVATADETGLVTAHAVPQHFFDTPYVDVSADGVVADNASLIRVTSTDLGVIHQMYTGTHVAFYLPAIIEEVDLDQITTDYQVVEATDLAYLAQEVAMDAVPSRGGLQYLVLDVTDDPNTVPCGTSGNPIRLGWEFGKPVHNSCYIINDPPTQVPQWFVIFHEMGHNFTYCSYGFFEFCNGPSGQHNVAYIEGLASLAAMWSWDSIVRCSGGLSSFALSDLDGHFLGYAASFRSELSIYQNAGANYADLNASVVDGILCEMCDAYGPGIWFDLFSTFLPIDEPLPYPLDTVEKQATWFVAALSASAGEDLRDTFSGQYGFPIDEAVWADFLASAQDRIDARVWQPPPEGDLDCDGCVNQSDLGILLTDWGCTGGDCPGDADGDGDTDHSDLGVVLAHWGEGC
jgi:hypothetical protein